jgi:hypothetical protein
LAKAPPSDIVHLSDQAMQLQEVDGLFGNSPSTETSNPAMAMQNVLTAMYSGPSVNLLA